MKRRLLLLMLVFSMSISCINAQKLISGTFTLPASEKYLAVAWDFSEAVIEKKYDEKEWEMINGKEVWASAKAEALGNIIVQMNEKMKKSRLICISLNSEIKPAYTLYIHPLTLNRKGDNKSLYILKETETGQEIGRAKRSGDGGSFGDLANLLLDGYEEAARAIGSYLTSKNKLK